VLSFRFLKKSFVQILSVPQVIHRALHCAKLECIEEGDDLSSDCAVVLLEHEVSQLDQQQHGKGGHLAADLRNRRHFTLKHCLTKERKICLEKIVGHSLTDLNSALVRKI
jgi:hypothetical protein